MALFLHLSDLHLGALDGPGGAAQILDDYKSDIVAPAARTNRVGLLGKTLAELGGALAQAGRALDAVIVSGDVTVGDDEAGYRMLPGLLAHLGPALPPPSRIVVVPGNHDVTWRTAPSCAARYRHFVGHVRAQGYVTPLLDGLDESAGDDGHFLAGDGWLVVPMNSADYCGSLEGLGEMDEDLWRELPALAAAGRPGTDARAVEKALARLRVRDVPRVSKWQLDALQALVRRQGSDGRGRTRIAVLHHQLLPVSTKEEFKAFESIVNLGLVRQFLRDAGFHVVLHGHKHQGYVCRDHVHDFARPDLPAHELVVVSGATIGAGDYSRTALARLVETSGGPHAPVVEVASLPALDAGQRLDLSRLERVRHRLWSVAATLETEAPPLHLVHGASTDEAYARLLALFDGRPAGVELYDVVCQVAGGEGAGILPSLYPALPGVDGAARQAWLDRMVDWWQRSETRLARAPARAGFTHGGRIARYGDGHINQLERVVKALAGGRQGGSKAVASLLRPETDNVADGAHEVPAFLLLQFVVRTDDGKRRLDVIGYFRKQDLRWWWPINVAELARLQKQVWKALVPSDPHLAPGAITTVAAVACAGPSPPRLAVPEVDRLLDASEHDLWSMVYAVFWPDMPRRDEQAALWRRILDDLEPDAAPHPDGAPVALTGLRFLADTAKQFSRHHRDARGKSLARQLDRLHRANVAHAKLVSTGNAGDGDHASWREDVNDIVDGVRGILSDMFSK